MMDMYIPWDTQVINGSLTMEVIVKILCTIASLSILCL